MPDPDVTARIVPHVSSDGHPFAEVHYTILEDDGRTVYATSRMWHPISDTPLDRAREVQQFHHRRKPGDAKSRAFYRASA